MIDTRTYKVDKTYPFKFEVCACKHALRRLPTTDSDHPLFLFYGPGPVARVGGRHAPQVNEIEFNRAGTALYVTTGKGTVAVHDFPSMAHRHTLQAHTSNCYCIDFDATGRYMATGGADALATLWDVNELVPVRTFRRLEYDAPRPRAQARGPGPGVTGWRAPHPRQRLILTERPPPTCTAASRFPGGRFVASRSRTTAPTLRWARRIRSLTLYVGRSAEGDRPHLCDPVRPRGD